MIVFWKNGSQKQVFRACEKGAFFSVSVYFGKMPNFAGLWCPNRLTHRDSWGIIGKIISIAFIWYLVVLCVTTSLVTIASWKSGLILSPLKMLISVLSNKAVLENGYQWGKVCFCYPWTLQTVSAPDECVFEWGISSSTSFPTGPFCGLLCWPWSNPLGHWSWQDMATNSSVLVLTIK